MHEDGRASLPERSSGATGNHRWLRFLEAVPGATVVVTHAGEVLVWNAETEELTGCPSQGTLGRHVSEVLGADNPITRALDHQCEEDDDDYSWRATGGELLALRVVARPVLDEAGELAGVVAKLQNRSQRRAVLSDVVAIMRAVGRGELDQRVDESRFDDEYRVIAHAMNDLMEAICRPVHLTTEYMDRISRGDIPEPIDEEFGGEFNEIKHSLNRCISSLSNLVDGVNHLAMAAVEGSLAERADRGLHHGAFQRAFDGINLILDALCEPIFTANDYIRRITAGDLPPRLEGKYEGDFQAAQSHLNAIIGIMRSMLDELIRLIRGVRSGDLTMRADAASFGGEWNRLVRGINAIMMVFQAVMQRVSSSTIELTNLSKEIASNVGQVSQSASSQAAMLQETAASIDEMASMTRSNAANTKQAHELTSHTNRAAAEGSEAMHDMLSAMAKIRDAAESTAQIIRDINEISFQTNLLALNAAVEAARAGDAGRGFAVVAEEVRSLALRSKEAAKRTEDLIRQSVELADQGSQTCNLVNANLDDIVQSVAKVNQIVAEISTASEEQARGADQVNSAIAQMDKLLQNTVSELHDSSESAQMLAEHAAGLDELVAQFRLEANQRQQEESTLQ